MATPAGNPGAPRTIKASEFKATCLKLMDEVAESGEEIIITKNGKPIARLTPHRKRFETPFGRDRHLFGFVGDIITPVDIVWEAEQGLIDGK